jgi:hypothetical protein
MPFIARMAGGKLLRIRDTSAAGRDRRVSKLVLQDWCATAEKIGLSDSHANFESALYFLFERSLVRQEVWRIRLRRLPTDK